MKSSFPVFVLSLGLTATVMAESDAKPPADAAPTERGMQGTQPPPVMPQAQPPAGNGQTKTPKDAATKPPSPADFCREHTC